MSGFCGYEPAMVEALRAAMKRALDELDGLHCSDAEAAEAMRVVSSAQSTLRDTWLPFTSALLACRALDGYQPATIDPGDLVNSWLRITSAERGWQTATDPLGSARFSTAVVATVEQVRALGAALSGAAGSDPMTTDEVASLAMIVGQIGARQELRAAFLPAFTTVGWTNVCNQLAKAKRHLVTESIIDGSAITADERLRWADIDAAFAGLGAVVVGDRIDHPRADSTLLLEDMSPFAAASLAVRLGLDAQALAETTRRVIEHEQAMLDPADETVLGPRPADLLFDAMLATPGAPTAYMVLTADAPQLAMEATTDPDVAHRLVAVGTDPSAITFQQAAVVMPALVRWVLDAREWNATMVYDPELMSTLATLAAPHLLALLTSGADSYGMSTRERRAMESAVMNDRTAFARLLAERDRVVAGVVEHAARSGSSARLLDDVAQLLAVIDSMQRVRTVRHAEEMQAQWNLMWDLLDRAAGLAPLAGPWALVPGASLALLRKVLEDSGVAPDSVGTMQARALQSFDAMTTAGAAAVVCAMFDQMVAGGRIPGGAAPPPLPDMTRTDTGSEYAERFGDWLAASEFNPDVEHELRDGKETIASTHEAARNENDALLGG